MSAARSSVRRTAGIAPAGATGRGRLPETGTAAYTGDAHSGQTSPRAPASHVSPSQKSRSAGYSSGHFPQKARSTATAGRTKNPRISRKTTLQCRTHPV